MYLFSSKVLSFNRQCDVIMWTQFKNWEFYPLETAVKAFKIPIVYNKNFNADSYQFKNTNLHIPIFSSQDYRSSDFLKKILKYIFLKYKTPNFYQPCNAVYRIALLFSATYNRQVLIRFWTFSLDCPCPGWQHRQLEVVEVWYLLHWTLMWPK